MISLSEMANAAAQFVEGLLPGEFMQPPRPRFKRTEPTPYSGRAKFRQRVKPGDGLDCFEEKDCSGLLVVQLPKEAWRVTPETAGHVVAAQIGNTTRRKESSILGRVRWG